MSIVAANERLNAKRNEKRVRALKLADTGPCGYCGTPCKSDLCPKHEHLRFAYREDDDRWQSMAHHLFAY